MAMVLYPHDLLVALTAIDHPSAAQFRADLTLLCDRAAGALASRLDVIARPAVIDGSPDTNQGVVFEPAYAGQPCPPLLAEFDEDTEWGED